MIKLISTRIEILIKRKIGSKRVETIIKPVPIPIEIFEKIFKKGYFVSPTMFKMIGMKNIKDVKNIIKRFNICRLKNKRMTIIVNTTVG